MNTQDMLKAILAGQQAQQVTLDLHTDMLRSQSVDIQNVQRRVLDLETGATTTVTASTPAVTTEAKEPKAPVKYRTAKQIETGKAKVAAIWAEAYAEAGVKRYADLTPAQQKAAKAKVDAAWKAIKGTRSTKVA